MTILDAIGDPNVFAPWFRDLEGWRSWLVLLAALFALPMSEPQLETYRRHTGRSEPPTSPASEAWLVCGRRAGKSFVLALVAVYLANFRDHRPYLAPGERATVLVLATDRRQARVIFRYVRALLEGVAMIAATVRRETAESFDLSNGVTIEIGTASYRRTRGYSYVAVLCDELAFWPTSEESVSPDYEVLDAVRPGMATIPGAMLLCASSPYARRGALWDAFRRHYGPQGDPDVLVWRAATRDMNPTVSQRIVDAAMERDPSSAAAEWLAEFRSDIESYINREAIEACVPHGVRERAPVDGVRYVAFVDPSGGSSDSFTCAIAHRLDDGVVLDALREAPPPFSPEGVVAEFAQLLKSYRVTTVIGDRYAGEWPREAFRRHDISYQPSARPKSELYQGLLPRLNARSVDLLDHPRLIAQLSSLERRTSRGGRDSIDHAPGAHDDVANAVAGIVVSVMDGRSSGMRIGIMSVPGAPATVKWQDAEPRQRAWSRQPGISAETGRRKEPTPVANRGKGLPRGGIHQW